MSRVHVTEWIRAIAADYTKHPDHRQGQRAFNTLCKVQPELAERIRGTDLDPFHQDERVPKFVLYVTDKLMKEKEE